MTVPRTQTFACSTAGASWTTFIPTINDSLMGLQVVYSGLTSEGRVWLKATNVKDADYAKTLTQTYCTMAATSGALYFNIRDVSYNFLTVYYDNQSNSDGIVQLVVTNKSDV